MLHKTRVASVIICAISLSACMSYNPHGYSNYRSYVYEGEPLYPESYDNGSGYNNSGEKKQVVVPETYLMNTSRAPTSHKDQDKSWVSSQNPQGYTIELADDDKPASVAGKLQKAPKNERMAEVRYENDGKTHYKGLYGTFGTAEAAQQALSALPADVKAGATVKNWGAVQGSVNH